MRYLQNNTMRLLLPIALFATAPQLIFADNSFVQNNLVSDGVCGTDPAGPKLINAWGIDRAPTSPWWVNANGSGVSCLFTGTGGAVPLVVTIPPPSGSTPTGIVFNPTGDFQVAMGAPAHFIFATEDGTISGWNSGTVSVQKVATPNAVYKGITMGVMNGANVLYAANFHANSVDVFDASYMPVTMPSGSFTDSRIPAGFAPFNVQNINGFIVVTFAKQNGEKHDDVAGPGNGYVDIFSPSGVLMKRLEHNKFLNSPWGVTLAPSRFGELGGRLLVGNFGSGQIASYEWQSGEFDGLMRGAKGKPITIDGLWGLKFGNDAAAGPSTTLFFSAGPNGEQDGLFGTLTPSPKKNGDDGDGHGGDDQGGDH